LRKLSDKDNYVHAESLMFSRQLGNARFDHLPNMTVCSIPALHLLARRRQGSNRKPRQVLALNGEARTVLLFPFSEAIPKIHRRPAERLRQRTARLIIAAGKRKPWNGALLFFTPHSDGRTR
jgi:hypothetical protein